MAVDMIARGMAASAASGGSGGGGNSDAVILSIVEEGAWWHLNKTWQEINNDLYAGKRVVLMMVHENASMREVLQMPVVAATYDTVQGNYVIYSLGPNNYNVFGYASDPNDYPTVDQ